jgi:hypothetical protein
MPGLVRRSAVAAPPRSRRWLRGLLLAAGLVATGPVTAEERFHAGLMDLSLSVGPSLSHDRKEVDHVYGRQVLPHFGYFVSRYFEVLAEPTVIVFRSDTDTSSAMGFSLVGRLLLDTGTRVTPYLEVGAGVLAGQLDFRQTNCNVNFPLAVGTGILVFVGERTALSAGYRVQHVSNADRCDQNLGINSSLFLIGISHFFE